MNEIRKDDPCMNIKFVKIVEKYPCLYNYKLPEYSRRDVTDKAWMNVAKEMNYTVPHCKEKWRNVRSVFVRKLKPSPSGTSMKSSKPYYLNRFMSFLVPYIKTNHKYDDIPSTVPSPNQAEEDDDPAKMDFPEQSGHEQKYTESEQTVTVKKQKDKLNEYLQPREGEIIGTNDNSRKMFLISLLPEINAMTENQMRVFRRKVLQLIDEISNVSDTME